LGDEEIPTAMPEHADSAIEANPSANQPCTAGSPTCTLTAPQEDKILLLNLIHLIISLSQQDLSI